MKHCHIIQQLLCQNYHNVVMCLFGGFPAKKDSVFKQWFNNYCPISDKDCFNGYLIAIFFIASRRSYLVCKTG